MRALRVAVCALANGQVECCPLSLIEPLRWVAVECAVILSDLLGLGDRRANTAPPTPSVDVRRLRERWQAAQALATAGFMALHAVRERGHVVDFELDSATAAAVRLLHADAPSLRGRRLAHMLAGHDGGRAVFNHYWRVLEFGAAQAVHHRVPAADSKDVLRHAAVRLSDGVAVRLTNVSALRRLSELQSEIESRALISSSMP